MKKLFTFLMAMFVVSMTFAQTNKYAVTGITPSSEQSRSNWYGWFSESGYVHVQAAESEYMLFMPSGTFNTDVTLEKVRFYTIPSENITNYTGDPFTLDADFVIRIYTGSSVNGTDFTPGTLAYSQTYNPATVGAEAGPQEVILNTPFTVHPTDNVTIGIYSADMCSMGLGDDDPECANLNFAYWPDYSEGYHHYYYTGSSPAWAYENAPVNEHDPWLLSVFYNDGLGYQYICDWYSTIYDPEDTQTYPDEITRLVVDNYTDSIYFYGGTFNKGLDTSIGRNYISIYIEDANLGTMYFVEDEEWGQYDIDTLDVNYGWRIGGPTNPLGLVGLETQFEELGMTWPVQMCISSRVEFLRNSVDINEENNTYCITVGREEDFIGLEEVTNNLVVFPNPASNYIQISNEAGANISIYNLAGQEVLSSTITSNCENINVSSLCEGMYIVRISNGKEIQTCKVSIVR